MKMAGPIKENTKMIRNMAMVSTHGQTVKYMQANGKKENNMVKPNSLTPKARVKLANGKMVKEKSGSSLMKSTNKLEI